LTNVNPKHSYLLQLIRMGLFGHNDEFVKIDTIFEKSKFRFDRESTKKILYFEISILMIHLIKSPALSYEEQCNLT
jgi:hypothetical protein